MKRIAIAAVLLAASTSLSGCVGSLPLPTITPPGQQRYVSSFSNLVLDGQSQSVTVQQGAGQHGNSVDLCVYNGGKWNKAFRVVGYNQIMVKPGATECTYLNATQGQQIEFIKAKFLGVMTSVGVFPMDFRGHEGDRVTVNWTQE